MGDLLSFGGKITRSGDRNADEGEEEGRRGRERDRSESPEIDRFVESLFFAMIHPEKKDKKRSWKEEDEENDIYASAPPSPSAGHRKSSPRRPGGHSPIPSVSGSLYNSPQPPISPTSPPPPPSTSPPYLTPPPVSPPTTASIASPPPTTASISSVRRSHLPAQRVSLAQSVSFDSPLNRHSPSPSSSFAPTRPIAPRTQPVKRPASSPPPPLHKLSILSVANLKEAFRDGEMGRKRLDQNGIVMDPLKPFSLQSHQEGETNRTGE